MSCSSNNKTNKICKEDNFGYLMYQFYNNHLRYPKSTNDYFRMIYVHDSINDFKFAHSLSGKYYVRFNSCKEYVEFVDSVYSSNEYAGGVDYMSWKAYYKNQSDDDIRYKDGKLFFYNKDDGCTYYTYDIKTLVDKWFSGEKKFNDFDGWEWVQISNYINIKMCTVDSITIEYPDSVFDKIKAYKDLACMVNESNINRQNIKSENKTRGCGIRYYRNGTICPIDGGCDLPEEIVNNKCLINYMDSCVHIDKRIDFMQFYLVKIFKK